MGFYECDHKEETTDSHQGCILKQQSIIDTRI